MGVYNQHLAKLDGASLHGNNMVLYSSGMFVNGICYLVTRIFIPGEPGFFTGYNSFSAIMVVVSNVLIGLVITAVYRCKSCCASGYARASASRASHSRSTGRLTDKSTYRCRCPYQVRSKHCRHGRSSLCVSNHVSNKTRCLCRPRYSAGVLRIMGLPFEPTA